MADSSSGAKAPAFPRRHCADLREGRRMARPLRPFIRGNPEPTLEELQALGAGLSAGDPVADALAEWMFATGMAKAQPQFQQALQHGIASLEQPAPVLAAFFAECERKPEWLDEGLLNEGAAAFQSAGMSAYYVLRDMALMGGYQAAGFNKTLVLTGALNGRAPRRVAETMKWANDISADGGLARGAEGWRATLQVRLVHALIRRRVRAMPEWQPADWGLPVNQTDMAATYLGFSVVLLLGLRVMGVPVSQRQGRALMHFWSYACWLMGVDSRWLRADEQSGRRLLYSMLLTQLPPDESSRQLGRALMAETLQMPYPAPRALRQRFEQARHLSVSRLFVGRKGMAALGLPAGVLPWYPLLSAPFTFANQAVHRLLIPGGRERLRRRGRAAQEAILQLHFGMLSPELISLHAASGGNISLNQAQTADFADQQKAPMSA